MRRSERRGSYAAALLMVIAASAAIVAISVPHAALAQEQARPADPDYTNSATLRERAMNALLDRLGHKLPPVSKLEIFPDRIVLWVQGSKPYYTDEWTVSRSQFLMFDNDNVSGPTATDGDGAVAKRETSFFALPENALAGIDTLLAAAKATAQLEDEPRATITLNRALNLFPEASYGEPTWLVELRTPRESATLWAGLDGRINLADLDNTLRIERLNLFTDEYPLDLAQAAIAEKFAGTRLTRLDINRRDISIDAVDGPGIKRDYSWSPSGMRIGMRMPYVNFGQTEPFAVSEIDLTRFGEVKRNALEAYRDPKAKITTISIEKSVTRPGGPVVLWKIGFGRYAGDPGAVLLDAKANVVDVELPVDRQGEAGPSLSGSGMGKFMDRLAHDFGKDALFAEIIVDGDGRANVLVEDAQAPGTMARFNVDLGKDTSRSAFTPSPRDQQLDPGRVFHLSDLTQMVENIEALEAQTMDQMKKAGIGPYRVTFSRRLLQQPEESRLLLEIKTGNDWGDNGGTVTWEPGGTAVAVDKPSAG
jgi:hypothetical protein